MNSTDFHYESGKNKLVDLQLGMGGPLSMQYTTVVDDTVLEMENDEGRGSRQGQLMRLAASVNLDSQLTVRNLKLPLRSTHS
jgi:DNA mismatch repair protein MSH5